MIDAVTQVVPGSAGRPSLARQLAPLARFTRIAIIFKHLILPSKIVLHRLHALLLSNSRRAHRMAAVDELLWSQGSHLPSPMGAAQLAVALALLSCAARLTGRLLNPQVCREGALEPLGSPA
jgi:hypothetical protein